jgi:hypothetical protein
MPTIEALMDIEGQVESAVTTHLTAKLLPALKTNTGTPVDLELPRVECEAVVSGEGPHQRNVGSAAVYDQFQVDFAVRLMASANADQDIPAYRGLMRAVMLDRVAIQTLLDDLIIAPDSYRQTGGARTVERDQDAEIVEANYSMQVFVKPASWPASIVPVPPVVPPPAP